MGIVESECAAAREPVAKAHLLAPLLSLLIGAPDTGQVVAAQQVGQNTRIHLVGFREKHGQETSFQLT